MTHQSPARRNPARIEARRRRREGGFALVAALVILVLLSSIGAGMLRLSTLQRAGASGAILGARANWAAQSGIEWAAHQAQSAGACASGTLNLTEGALSGFRVVVTCTETLHREGGDTIRSLAIRSEASFGPLGTPEFVFREIRASVTL